MKQPKVTPFVLQFLDWNGGELRPIIHPGARTHLEAWQMKEVGLWVEVRARLLTDTGPRAAGYVIRKFGDTIRTGEIDWTGGRPYLTKTEHFTPPPVAPDANPARK